MVRLHNVDDKRFKVTARRKDVGFVRPFATRIQRPSLTPLGGQRYHNGSAVFFFTDEIRWHFEDAAGIQRTVIGYATKEDAIHALLRFWSRQ
jgi:hypothetical protein